MFLEKNVHNLKRVGKNLGIDQTTVLNCYPEITYHLTTTSCSTGYYFPTQCDPTSLRVRRSCSNEVVDGQFNSLFRCNSLEETSIVCQQEGRYGLTTS